MTTVNWHGPFNNPFQAAVKAMDADNIDTIEFTTYRLWDAVGAYDFHANQDDFIDDLLQWLTSQCGVIVRREHNGFYAAMTKEEVASTIKACPCCGHAAEITRSSDLGFDELNDNGYHVVCSVHTGGCGATSGYSETVEGAIARWNRRT